MRVEERQDVRKLLRGQRGYASVLRLAEKTGIRIDRHLMRLAFLAYFGACRSAVGWKTALGLYSSMTRGGGTMRIDLPGYEAPFAVRRDTSDPFVFISILLAEDYRRIKQLGGVKAIVDAGAYVGYSSVYFARHHPQARVFAVEPEGSNFELLEQHAAPYPNIVPIRAALWSHNGRLDMSSAAAIERIGHWGAAVKEAADGRPGSVAAVTIEELLRAHGVGRAEIVKIDIEGAEGELFKAGIPGWLAASLLTYVELHEHLVPGCAQGFFRAVNGMDCEVLKDGENLAVQPRHPLSPV